MRLSSLVQSRSALRLAFALSCVVAPVGATESSTSEDSSATEEQQASDPERALRHGHRGLEHFRAERWQQAHDEFLRADGLAHSPVFSLYAARSLVRLGRFVEARALLRALIDEPVTRETPTMWAAAVSDARLELDALERRLPHLEVVIAGDRRGRGLQVDGARFSPETLAAACTVEREREVCRLPLDPGTHRVELVAGDGRRLVSEVSLEEGQTRRVSLHLAFERQDVAVSPKERVASDREGSSPDAWDSSSSPARRVGTNVAWGAGAAGFLFAGVTGGMAVAKATELRDRCEGNRCYRDDAPLGDEARTYANLATVGLAVGVVGTSLGLALWLTEPSDTDRSTAGSARFVVHPSGVTLDGTF